MQQVRELAAARPIHRWVLAQYHRPAYPAVKSPGSALESSALQSIFMVYGDGRRGGGKLVRENLSLVVRGLKQGNRTAAGNAVGILYFFKSPEAVKALEWAREHHPNQTIRDGAARRLGHLGY